MTVRAVLKSSGHPEYGEVTVPFPIPREDYDHVVELLEGIGSGDVLRRDCRVVDLDSQYPILKRLEGSTVNVGELDYLAKRLDSFNESEKAQFQATASLLGLVHIADFINLTFCCQQATVITGFSDLEAIGRAHYMNIHGGCAADEELANLDGYENGPFLLGSLYGANNKIRKPVKKYLKSTVLTHFWYNLILRQTQFRINCDQVRFSLAHSERSLVIFATANNTIPL